MKHYLLLIFLFFVVHINSQQTVADDFEGNGTITSWFADDINLNTSAVNPFKEGINTSNTVLEYKDVGGQYANVRFDVDGKFDLSVHHTFSFKIYIPSASLTGSQTNQVSLKLQNNTLNEPWSTQTEIIKTLVLDQWQTVTFNFKDDNYINLDANSAAPVNRTDLDRVLIQVNGENNTDNVTAYIDDFLYDGTIEKVDEPENPVFDNLVWYDEFDGNGAVNNTKWFHQTLGPNNGRWFNGELQHYTNSTSNSYQQNGNLYIVGKKETKTQDGVTLNYTSARLNSKFAFTYGRVDVRAILPKDNGTWPAIWTLGKNISEPGAYWETQGFGTTPWPATGEIDIMEHGLHSVNEISAALHTPSSSGGTVNTKTRALTDVGEYHVYSMIWTEEKITFLVDDVEFYTYNPSIKNDDTWPFYKDQFLLLNLAIGGYSGNVANNFTDASFIIDYVRVYQESKSLNTENVNTDKTVVSIYPNPVNNNMTLNLGKYFSKSKAVLYNLAGQKIYTFQQKVQNETHNLSFLKRGIYLLKVDSDLGSKIFKIIKN